MIQALACSPVLLALGVLLSYVLPVEGVVAELVRLRAKAVPLRIEATLSELDGTEPRPIVMLLHPLFGLRVSDNRGGSWWLHPGRTHLAPRGARPGWIPDLEIMALQEESELLSWLTQARVDLLRNELARCDERDCYVLGGRSGARGQLWLDKVRFEVVRMRLPDGRRIDLQDYRDWGRLRFPRTIRIQLDGEPYTRLEVQQVTAAPDLDAGHFAP